MTKEAKLTAAVRIVPEWTEYDEEIKRLQQRIHKGYYSTDGGENPDTDQHSQKGIERSIDFPFLNNSFDYFRFADDKTHVEHSEL